MLTAVVWHNIFALKPTLETLLRPRMVLIKVWVWVSSCLTYELGSTWSVKLWKLAIFERFLTSLTLLWWQLRISHRILVLACMLLTIYRIFKFGLQLLYVFEAIKCRQFKALCHLILLLVEVYNLLSRDMVLSIFLSKILTRFVTFSSWFTQCTWKNYFTLFYNLICCFLKLTVSGRVV